MQTLDKMDLTKTPLVSIIIPIFNSGRYITETIESVLNQRYTNWELILVDDGSTDDSRIISEGYSSKYPEKIICAAHVGNINKGLPSTRNLGLSLAKGSLVALLDSDDLWMPDYLEEQVSFLVNNKDIDVVCQASIYWRTWNNPKEHDEVILVGAPSEKIYTPPELAVALYPFGNGAAPCMDGIVMRTEALKRIGGFEESFKGKNHLYEDQAFNIKNYLKNVVYLSSSAKNLYRQRPDSMMHGIIEEGLYDNGRYFFLRWLKVYLKDQMIKDKAVHKLLNRALIPYKYPYLYKISSGIHRRYKQLLNKLSAAAIIASSLNALI
ncbi:MAG TPA: glycosyltransferase family 2 protein [Pedobacter sp.]|jgi:glycosyltransferase involved in cell wall biosynthesis